MDVREMAPKIRHTLLSLSGDLENEDCEQQKIYETVPWPHVPEASTASKMDTNDKDMTMGLQRKQRNRYTEEEWDKIIYSSLILAVSLKAPAEANVDSKDLEDQVRSN